MHAKKYVFVNGVALVTPSCCSITVSGVGLLPIKPLLVFKQTDDLFLSLRMIPTRESAL